LPPVKFVVSNVGDITFPELHRHFCW
jgi:hypothetical protein